MAAASSAPTAEEVHVSTDGGSAAPLPLATGAVVPTSRATEPSVTPVSVPEPTGLRVRRLVRRSLAGSASPGLGAEPLVAVHRRAHPKADFRMLYQAYEVAEGLHRGQMRKSGEPYITHPLAVATILAELGMDTTTLAAALLHDTVEDTDYTLDQVRHDFGGEVAHLVDGVTKLDKVTLGEAAEAETFRKIIVSSARDLRVLVIKLADRLHNMRTLRFKSPPSQQRTARVTLKVLVPLADRLGIHVLKRELEDLALAVLDPKAYERVDRLVRKSAFERARVMSAACRSLEVDLRHARIKAVAIDRPKHYYSIHQALTERGDSVSEVGGTTRLLVEVDGESTDCYVALGVVHGRWRPVRGRFKDLIATPKFNMYQSLHTTVMGPGGEPLEVMVRTREMHRVADYGIAAHIKIASESATGSPAEAARRIDDMLWLRRLLSWQMQATDPDEFLKSLALDLTEREVLTFTPKGRAVTLPSDSTPVDFAYALRGDIGHRCVGARVNGRLFPLSSPLTDGDVVEIITSPTASPAPDWLDFAKSPQAHIKIRHWLSTRAREDVIEAGRQVVNEGLQAHRHRLNHELVHATLIFLSQKYGYDDLDDLFAAIAAARVEADPLIERLVAVATVPDEPDGPDEPDRPDGSTAEEPVDPER
jgi:GTP diphosphokinase / guanosine-3',5'-bis(diphosphate) 3'-diphosphatase